MTETTTTPDVALNAEQTARAAALAVAQTVLTGTGSLFGGTGNTRDYRDIIEVAEYIVNGARFFINGVPAVDEPEPEPAPTPRTPEQIKADARLAAFVEQVRADSALIAKQTDFPRFFLDVPVRGDFNESCGNPECPCQEPEAPAPKLSRKERRAAKKALR